LKEFVIMGRKPSEIIDYHERLGVPESASMSDIRKAYLEMASKYHPDKNIGSEEESELEFVAIGEAYGVLTKGRERTIHNDSVWESSDGLGKGVSVGNVEFPYHEYMFRKLREEGVAFTNRVFSGNRTYHNNS